MLLNPNKTPIEIIYKKTHLVELILEIYIRVLMVNGTVIVGKSLIFYVILILNCVRVIIMMLMLINIK